MTILYMQHNCSTSRNDTRYQQKLAVQLTTRADDAPLPACSKKKKKIVSLPHFISNVHICTLNQFFIPTHPFFTESNDFSFFPFLFLS